MLRIARYWTYFWGVLEMLELREVGFERYGPAALISSIHILAPWLPSVTLRVIREMGAFWVLGEVWELYQTIRVAI